jgi:predicted Zn-dependent protease
MFRISCFSLFLGLFSVAGFAQSATNQPTGPPASASSKTQQNPISSTVSAAPATATPIVASSASGSTMTPGPALANPLGEALLLYRKGKFEDAIAKYQEILKDHPNSPDAFAAEVRVYLKQKKVDQASQEVEQGLAQSNSPCMKVAPG